MPVPLNDAVLLERFASDHEDAAFVELVRRHGPRVERVCRRVLRNEHDVDDAFQATFVVLARRAHGVAWQESVGGWLGSVAHRLSMSIRSSRQKRSRRERVMAELGGSRSALAESSLAEHQHPAITTADHLESQEIKETIVAELERLPEKYRAPVVLCDLEGLTHQEAAERLGWPSGSLSRRLGKARAILRHRLASKGLALALIGLTAATLMWSFDRLADGRRNHERSLVRQSMSAFRTDRDEDENVARWLVELTRENGEPANRDHAKAVANQATAAALAIKTHDPGAMRQEWQTHAANDDWRTYTLLMEGSATQLAQASEAGDQPAIVAAARKLEASCVDCHRVFHME
jgi:RNA polymerase sigma factor (sigma-70 family)